MHLLALPINPKLFLFDTLLFSIAALFIGLLYYRFIVKKNEAIAATPTCGVQTSLFRNYDLTFALLIVGFFSLNVILPTFISEETLEKLKDKKPSELMQALNIWIVVIIQFVIPCTVILLLLYTRTNPLDLFRLRNKAITAKNEATSIDANEENQEQVETESAKKETIETTKNALEKNTTAIKQDEGEDEAKPMPFSLIIPLSIGAGFLIWIGLGVLLHLLKYESLMEYVFGTSEQQDVVKAMANAKSIFLKLTMTFLACIAAPLCEELIFRGYFYPALKKYTGIGFAVVLNSLIFAVIHGSVTALLPLFLLSLILVLSYEYTKSLWAPIFIHATFNTLTTILLFLKPFLPEAP